MLNALRNLARTWIGKILGLLLIVGLAGFGISNVIFTLGTNSVASVGGEEISVRDFQRAYNSQLNAMAQRIGRVPTTEEAVASGLVSNVIGQLSNDVAVNSLAKDMGLGASDARLAELLRQDSSFFNALGNFDRTNFERVLEQSGYTEAEYFELQANAARRQQLIAGLLADPPAPTAATALLGRYAGDTRTVDYFVLNTAFLPPVEAPTDEELQAYLEENQSRFRTQETRVVDVLALSPAVLAENMIIGEDEIAEEYERTRASRQRVEKRTIVQVGLATPELVTAFETGKAEGKSFDTLVSEAGLTTEPLGTLAQAEIRNSDLADAAFSTDEGDFTIIDGIGAKRAIAVTAIEPAGETSLAEASEEIAQSLALKQARNEYNDILDQIEELRAAFRPLDEIAERFDLDVSEVTMTADGEALAAVPGLPEEDRSRVASRVFTTEVGDLAPTVTLGANANVWFDLKSVEPARDQTLEEVREQLVAELTAQRESEALSAEVDRLTAEIESGTSFDDVAINAGQFPQLSQPLTRGGSPGTEIDSTVASAIFGGGAGHFGSALNSNGNQVLFKVVDVTPGDTAATDAMTQFVADGTLESLYVGLITGIKDSQGVTLNNAVLSSTLGLDSAAQ
ncbi:SurA N-terminal domain-containing protein [Devosia sp.]|uniref:peptidylprolyl isomerase n=1 Tax=Devosia sp. TaxID=1871048 RepID=UPI003A8FE5B1